jgi:hypothetical protein
LTLTNFPENAVVPGSTTFSYRIERGPKVFDPATNILTLWQAGVSSGKGAVPSGRLIAWFLDRLVIAGTFAAPHAWFMSRIGDPFDWDYGAPSTDVGRAFASDNEDFGKIGVPITALIPGGTDYIIFATEESLWIMRGDPGKGAFLDNLSHSIGVVSAQAWAHGPGGELLFLSKDGLYGVAPGGDQFPVPISRERLPRAMRGIDSARTEVIMAYDVDAQGFHIHIIPKEGSARGAHWWFDWENKSFWPVSFFLQHEPRSIYRYESVGPGRGGVVLGCQDGFLRRYSKDSGVDSNVQFPTSVVIGPIRMSLAESDGMLTEMNAIMAKDSGSVSWSVKVGETAEDALRAGAFAEGIFNGGRNRTVRPRARGHAFYIRIEGVDGHAWAMEEITARIRQLGKARVS